MHMSVTAYCRAYFELSRRIKSNAIDFSCVRLEKYSSRNDGALDLHGSTAKQLRHRKLRMVVIYIVLRRFLHCVELLMLCVPISASLMCDTSQLVTRSRQRSHGSIRALSRRLLLQVVRPESSRSRTKQPCSTMILRVTPEV